jgi:hypothetical protein
MPKLPSLDEIEKSATEEYSYDFAQASRILEAMDFLRREALQTRIPEIIEMIDASFTLMLTTYYVIMRHRMRDLPEAECELINASERPRGE